MATEPAITVLFFAAAAERMMCGGVEVPLDPSLQSVGDLRHLFATSSPSLAGMIDRCAVAVNHEYATDDTPLSPGDEVAIIPPVSGG
jgi:molybdopterin converting factor subunit 1